MLKMDFPRFGGEDVQIWLDGCEAHFALYDILEGFKVTSATLHLDGDVANWYHALKSSVGWLEWEQFDEAMLQEFDYDMSA